MSTPGVLFFSEANQLVAECLARYGPDHPDKDNLDIIPIPITIIGTKYDQFQNFDPEKKKIISKTLRYVAHHHGAHLCVSSSEIYCSYLLQVCGSLATVNWSLVTHRQYAALGFAKMTSNCIS